MKRSTAVLARGFTLIEVLIVVAIASVLAAIALPAYQEHLRRGRRAEAIGSLLAVAHWLERGATASGSYLADAADFPEAMKQVPSRSYVIAFEAAKPAGTGYTLSAIPQHSQADDRCGSLTLDQAGQQGLAFPSASEAQKAECWTR